MSLRNSSAFAKKTTKLRTSPSSYQLTTDYTTNSVEDLDESLVVEDLDLANLEISSASNGSSLSPQDEDIPGVVSEACVKNDLYILVKVPTNQKNYVSTTTTSSQTTPKSSRVKRNSSIFPIEEEEEVEYSQTRTTICRPPVHKNSCWTKEAEKQEEFNSTTNFTYCGTQDILTKRNPGPFEQEDPVFTSHVGHSVPCQNQIELQEINLNSVRSKDRSNVDLQNYGILITPTKMPKTDNLLVFQVDTEAQESQKNSSSSCFQWLRKFFNRSHQRPGIVHAKVYKTYFVKWKKCPGNQCPCPRDFRAANHVVRSNSA